MNTSRDSEAGRTVVLLFGGPGAGKGTQAHLLTKSLRVPHISSGDLLRARQAPSTQELMKRGELLPDKLVADVVLARLEQPDAERGAILDGFPRTLAQARALDAWLEQHGGPIRAAVYLDVATEELVRRILDRGEVSGRADDQAQAAPRRVEAFLQELPPVLNHYADRGLLRRVGGTGTIQEVHQQIVQALANPPTPAH